MYRPIFRVDCRACSTWKAEPGLDAGHFCRAQLHMYVCVNTLDFFLKNVFPFYSTKPQGLAAI
jgi:hypothetical protein